MLPDKNKILDSGFTKEQTYYALKKAQIGYHMHAWIICKLER